MVYERLFYFEYCNKNQTITKEIYYEHIERLWTVYKIFVGFKANNSVEGVCRFVGDMFVREGFVGFKSISILIGHIRQG